MKHNLRKLAFICNECDIRHKHIQIQFKVRRLADLILEEKKIKEQKEKKENEEIKTRKDAERSSKVVSQQKIINCFKTTQWLSTISVIN